MMNIVKTQDKVTGFFSKFHRHHHGLQRLELTTPLEGNYCP
jgi:hypothetical protein